MADFPKMLDDLECRIHDWYAVNSPRPPELYDAVHRERTRLTTYVSLLEAVETAARNYFMGKGGAFAVFDALQALDVWKKENGHG